MKPPLTRLKISPSTRSAFSKDFDGVADFKLGRFSRLGEFFEGDAPFGFQTDIDDGNVFFDGGDDAFDNRFFKIATVDEGGFKHFREIVAGRVKGFRHV